VARRIAGAENVAEAAIAPAAKLLPSNRRRDNGCVDIWFLDMEETSCIGPNKRSSDPIEAGMPRSLSTRDT
jgi:hypothetical protein